MHLETAEIDGVAQWTAGNVKLLISRQATWRLSPFVIPNGLITFCAMGLSMDF